MTINPGTLQVPLQGSTDTTSLMSVGTDTTTGAKNHRFQLIDDNNTSLAPAGGGLKVSDAQSAAFSGVASITPGTAFTAGRSIGAYLTSSGIVTFTFSDGSTFSIPIAAAPSLQIFPFAVTNLVLSGGAAGSFWVMK